MRLALPYSFHDNIQENPTGLRNHNPTPSHPDKHQNDIKKSNAKDLPPINAMRRCMPEELPISLPLSFRDAPKRHACVPEVDYVCMKTINARGKGKGKRPVWGPTTSPALFSSLDFFFRSWHSQCLHHRHRPSSPRRLHLGQGRGDGCAPYLRPRLVQPTLR